MNKRVIEEGKPLPDHTKLKYEECYAKLILENYFPKVYSNLVLQDKPDLYSKQYDIGVEVIEAIPETIKEIEKLFYMMPYKKEAEAKSAQERMAQLGVPYQKYSITWPAISYDNTVHSDAYQIVYNAINTKLQKLNSVDLYQQCISYSLFIISYLFIKPEWHSDLADEFQKISFEYNKKYDKIYLLAINDLIEVDIRNKHTKAYNIEKKQSDIAMSARKIVEDGEML